MERLNITDGVTPVNKAIMDELQDNIDTAKEDKFTIINNVNGTAIKYADGTMIQYGSVNWNSGESYKTVSYPVAFIDLNYTFQPELIYKGVNSMQIYISSNGHVKSNIVYRRWSYLNWTDSGHSSLYEVEGVMPWFAIGKWK